MVKKPYILQTVFPRLMLHSTMLELKIVCTSNAFKSQEPSCFFFCISLVLSGVWRQRMLNHIKNNNESHFQSNHIFANKSIWLLKKVRKSIIMFALPFWERSLNRQSVLRRGELESKVKQIVSLEIINLGKAIDAAQALLRWAIN